MQENSIVKIWLNVMNFVKLSKVKACKGKINNKLPTNTSNTAESIFSFIEYNEQRYH